MSNAIFPTPTLPAGSRGWDIIQFPVGPETIIHTPPSKRGETRINRGGPYRVWQFQMNFPYLGGAFNDQNSALAKVVGFYMARGGAAASWLYDHPGDNTILTPVTFGVGDGQTSAFQLVRPIGDFLDIIQNVNGTPTIYAGGVNLTPRNQIPDSDGTGLTWSVNASLPFSPTGGAVTGGSWNFPGTGAPSNFQVVKSQIIQVIPGATYTLSGYIDATHATIGGGAGPPFWAVYDVGITTPYGTASQSAGVNGRVSIPFAVPAGVTQVRVIADTDNATVANATNLSFSDPQLELGSSATAYQSTNAITYSVDAFGVVTFLTPPALNTVLSWTGKYFFRCRFLKDDMGNLNNSSPNFWSCSQLEWISLII